MTFAITAAFFFVGTALLFKIKEKPREAIETQPSFVSELVEGLGTVWHTPWLAACIAMSSLQLMVVLASENVLLPASCNYSSRISHKLRFCIGCNYVTVGGTVSSLVAMRIRPKHHLAK